MTLIDAILLIAAVAVIGSLLIVLITALAHMMKDNNEEPQAKRSTYEQVAEYEILNDPAFHI